MDRTTSIIVLLIAALVLHLIEEIHTGFRQQVPGGGMPLSWFVGINVAVYSYCFATLIASVRNGKLATPFTWVFAVAMLLNGIGHVGEMIVRGRYFPGGATATLLLVISGYLMLHLLGIV